jgi:transcription elongation factor GreA
MLAPEDEDNMTRYPVTPEGFAALVGELTHLKEVVRGAIVRDIEDARAHGDISENSEYEDAKERQAHCDGRVKQLESRIASAEVIDITRLPPSDRVVFGATVTIENTKSGEKRTWRIVGEDQANVENAMISYRSPLGQALIGRRPGDEAVVSAPSGNQNWEIVEVEYR